MSDDDKTVGGKIRGPRREDMDAIWQALSERDAATEMCETWSSIAADRAMRESRSTTRALELETGIRNILSSEMPAGEVRRELRRLLEDGGA